MEALERFWSWMESTQRCKIVSFNVSGTELRQLFDIDPTDYWGTSSVATMSEAIDEFIAVPPEKLTKFKNAQEVGDLAGYGGDDDLYACYRLFKLAWLAEDIATKNVQEAPVQIFWNNRGYLCHPGSDKRLVITYLQPMESIRCFYIWYPELDPEPWHLTHEHNEVNTIQEFVDLFYRCDHPTFNFGVYTATYENGDGHWSDPHINAFGRGTLRTLKKELKDPNFYATFEHLSYRDAVHRHGMIERKDIINTIYLDDNNIFHMGEFKFVNENGIWIYDKCLNRPASLIDTNWKYDPTSALFTKTKYRNI